MPIIDTCMLPKLSRRMLSHLFVLTFCMLSQGNINGHVLDHFVKKMFLYVRRLSSFIMLVKDLEN